MIFFLIICHFFPSDFDTNLQIQNFIFNFVFFYITLIKNDILQCVVYDEQHTPRAPIHFLVVPKKRIPYFCDPSGNDERLIGKN